MAVAAVAVAVDPGIDQRDHVADAEGRRPHRRGRDPDPEALAVVPLLVEVDQDSAAPNWTARGDDLVLRLLLATRNQGNVRHDRRARLAEGIKRSGGGGRDRIHLRGKAGADRDQAGVLLNIAKVEAGVEAEAGAQDLTAGRLHVHARRPTFISQSAA